MNQFQGVVDQGAKVQLLGIGQIGCLVAWLLGLLRGDQWHWFRSEMDCTLPGEFK